MEVSCARVGGTFLRFARFLQAFFALLFLSEKGARIFVKIFEWFENETRSAPNRVSTVGELIEVDPLAAFANPSIFFRV